jgi:hypothetical protein
MSRRAESSDVMVQSTRPAMVVERGRSSFKEPEMGTQRVELKLPS